MRFDQPSKRPGGEEPVLPLINVVFLLLIFFMLAGRLTTSEPFRIEPPRSASDGRVEAQRPVVSVGATGRLALDGTVVEETALTGLVADRLAESGASSLSLKADGRADATRVVAVMELLREAGVERLELLTVSEPR